MKKEEKLTDTELLDWLEDEGYSLISQSEYSYADDYDGFWIVKGYVLNEKDEQVIGYGSTIRYAILDAMKDEEDSSKHSYIPPEYRYNEPE